MYPGVELRLYRYVIGLADALNFTLAASRLHVSQPTLSQQIHDLEEELGVRLFNRSKGGQHVTLTPAGEAFTAEARLTLFHAERAIEGARATKSQHKGPWRVAYSPLIDLRILQRIRRHLALAHPAAEVLLVSAYTAEQADSLMRGKLNAGLVILPLKEQGLTSEGLYSESLILALPKRHPLADKDAIEITDLHEIPLVTIRGDIEPRFGGDLQRILGVARVRPRIFHQATTQLEILELVAESDFAAGLILPSAQSLTRDGIVFRPFLDELLTVQTGLAYLRDDASPILKSLRKFLFETFKPLSPDSDALTKGRAKQMTLF
jgi:DNA-binding transcriptional LysR family regulator